MQAIYEQDGTPKALQGLGCFQPVRGTVDVALEYCKVLENSF